MNPFEHDDVFENQVFEDLTLERVDLGRLELTKCVFRRCKLGETRWQRSRLEDWVFEHCDLTRADFTGTSMHDVAFKRSKLMGIDFSHVAKRPSMSYEDCNLLYASFVGVTLRKTSFVRCAIREANFFEVDLTEARFDDCQFMGTRFEGCTFRGARFAGARDLFVDPVRNRVKDMHIPLETAILLATSYEMRVLGFLDAPRSVRRERVAERNRSPGEHTQIVPPEFFELASDTWEPRWSPSALRGPSSMPRSCRANLVARGDLLPCPQ
jgi:uncharacterized protein YjbI with pentapeptide repeats